MMARAGAIDGVLFDLDGLLLDTEAVGMVAFAEAVEVLGMIEADANALYLTMIGNSFEASRDGLAGIFPDVDLDWLDQSWTDAMARRLEVGVPMRPTVQGVMNGLIATGIPMAVVTSSRRKYVLSKLERVGFLRHLAGVVSADDVTHKKPNPEPYLKGAALLGLPPERCAAFEDSDTGTQAAIAARCQTWQIPDLRPLGKPVPQLGQTLAETLRDAVEDAGLLPPGVA